LLRIWRTGRSLAEFRPGVDTINLEWVYGGTAEWAQVMISSDSGDTWNNLAPTLSNGQARFRIPDSVYSFKAPPDITTTTAKIRLEKYDQPDPITGEVPAFADETDLFTITPWPDRFIKAMFPEPVTRGSTMSSSVVLVGLGDKRLAPDNYLMGIDDVEQLDRLFPPYTSINKAWRQAHAAGATSIYVVRAGDYYDWLNLLVPGVANPSVSRHTPRSFKYIHDGLESAYLSLTHVRHGVVCPVDAVVDMGDMGLGADSMFGSQLADYCYEQSRYVQPVFGVIAATTPTRAMAIDREYNKRELPADTRCPVQVPQMRAGSVPMWAQETIPGISLLAVSNGTPGGVGHLSYRRYNNGTIWTTGVRWAAPGEVPGTETTVVAGQTVSVTAAGGGTLTIRVDSLPYNDASVDVIVDHYSVHPGAKFVCAIYGYHLLEYNDTITGNLTSEFASVAPAAAATISVIGEGSDPLNKPIDGIVRGLPVLYESLIAVLAQGGVCATRNTISRGITFGANVTVAPRDGSGDTTPGWGSIKNVRVVGQVAQAIKRVVEAKYIGRSRVSMQQVEVEAKRACNKFVGWTIFDYSLFATRTGMYEADIDLTITVIDTLERLQTTIGVGI